MIEKVDEICARPFRALLRLLCSATGRSNFFFARTAEVVCVLAGAITTILTQQFMWGILTGLWVLQAVTSFQSYTKAEHEARSHCDLLPSAILPHSNVRFWRLKGLLVGSIMLLSTPTDLQYLGIAIGSYALAATLYFADDITPRGKSWLRRGLDWLGAHKPSFSITPSPQPEIT